MSTIYPDLAEILVSLDSEGIAIVRLHREESRNAFTSTMSESLVECYRRLDNSNDVKVVVLTGSPNAGNAFCAGFALFHRSAELEVRGPRADAGGFSLFHQGGPFAGGFQLKREGEEGRGGGTELGWESKRAPRSRRTDFSGRVPCTQADHRRHQRPCSGYRDHDDPHV